MSVEPRETLCLDSTVDATTGDGRIKCATCGQILAEWHRSDYLIYPIAVREKVSQAIEKHMTEHPQCKRLKIERPGSKDC